MNTPLCSDPKHLPSFLYFCKNCANGQKVADAFFCEQCSPEQKTKHKLHSYERKQLRLPQFKVYFEFKEKLIFHARKEFIEAYRKKYEEQAKKMTPKQLKTIYQETISKDKIFFKNALLQSSQKWNPKVQFQDEQYRRWLVTHQFWLLTPWQQPALKKQVLQHLINLIDPNSKTNTGVLWQDFKLVKSTSSAGAEEYRKEMESLRVRVEELAKEKQLGEIFARVTSYYSDDEIEEGLRQIQDLEVEYNPGHFLFLLAKLKTSELHTDGATLLKKFLNDPKLSSKSQREQQLHHYFTATAQWQVVQDEDQQDEGTRVFYETRNKRYYKLADPNAYIDSLTKAIKISAKPLYYACRAIGHMIMTDHQQAQFDFQQAQRLRFVSDVMVNNRIFNNIARKKQLDRTLLRQTLGEKSTHHIVNLCRYLKKIKDYEHLKLCCEELVSREPENISFRLRRFNAFFKLGDKDNAKEELSAIKSGNDLDEDEIIECERKIQLLKARENEEFNNLYDSQQKYKRVAEMGDQSATAWYNYAVFLFNHRQEIQRNEKALKAINKAIEIQPKQHYQQLKYLLLFVAGNMEEAKNMHTLIEDPEEKFKPMREHLMDNT